MYICLCRAVTDETIVRVIEGGASTLGAVARGCGAGTGCAGCRPAILALLRERAEAEARTEGVTVTPIRQAAQGSVDEGE